MTDGPKTGGLRKSLVRLYGGTLGRPRRHLLEESPEGCARQIDEALERHFRQIEATVALYSTVRFRLPLPPMRGWPISPDFACELVREIVRSRPARILELGSGVSTLVIGYALEAIGGGSILSLEHEADWFCVSAGYVQDHRLGDVVEIVYAPLGEVRIGDDTYPWYDCSKLPQGQLFDMLVVDGPPGTVHPRARYPALPVLLKMLAPDAVIVLDDANRPAEQAIVAQWGREYGPFVVESPVAEKGMLILRRQTEQIEDARRT